MKKLLLVLAFMFTMTFGFANSNEKVVEKEIAIESSIVDYRAQDDVIIIIFDDGTVIIIVTR